MSERTNAMQSFLNEIAEKKRANQAQAILDDATARFINNASVWNEPVPAGERRLHINLASGTIYKGINALNLETKVIDNPDTVRMWMTSNQIKETGKDFPQGEKSVPVIFYKDGKEYDYKKVNEQTGEETTEKRKSSYMSWAYVYNMKGVELNEHFKKDFNITPEKAFQNADEFIELNKNVAKIVVHEELVPAGVNNFLEQHFGLPTDYDSKTNTIETLSPSSCGNDMATFYQAMVGAIVTAQSEKTLETMKLTDDQKTVMRGILAQAANYFTAQKLGIGTDKIVEAAKNHLEKPADLEVQIDMAFENRTAFSKAFNETVKKAQKVCDDLTVGLEQNLGLQTTKLRVVNKELSAADKELKVYEPNVAKMGHYQGYVVGRGNGDTYIKVQSRQSGNYYLVKDKTERLQGFDVVNHEIDVQYSKNGKAYVKDLTVERAKNRDKGNSIAD